MAKRCFTLAILAGIICGQTASADVTVPITAVSFPKEVIPVEAGKIEFWAKLSGVSGPIDVGGGEPHFFQIFDGSSVFHAGFNANDGAANGGLVGIAGFQLRTGTGLFGSWTYEDIFGIGHVNEWHQYVFQWNKDGIPGVANGQQKVAIFVDGVLNSGIWHGTPGTPDTFVPLIGGTLNLITTGGNPSTSSGEVAIDEFKIYDGDNNVILWNTLGSAQEIAHSAVGLPGSFNGGGGAHFVPGIAGNAVMATPVVAIGPSTSCDGRDATIVGTNGNDILMGTNGDDVIVGLGGDDVIYGLGGNDVLCGGPGNDLLWGGAGRDRLFGEDGDDVLRGGSGADYLVGGLGRDILLAGAGNDQLFGQEGDDVLFGGDGADRLTGGPGRDTLFGGLGQDRLFGGADNDYLYGGADDDALHGGSGSDVCDGGPHSAGDTADTSCEAPLLLNVP